ncbi:pyruvate dehydrogenase (acetyl-transferring) E1 component subunit alpha [Euzebya tangerina]|uniref:pyruvate dehydrogenase (acetyl-transferring) E1 component subunit alpha n=1 Tax=Euzebya tangerina TaxID=591198 RepID=UPI000E31A0A7|nr:pyruvate dehydrogenase (acetyl-transferring) E1 component subunit alpha [Euzebya tangerina]
MNRSEPAALDQRYLQLLPPAEPVQLLDDDGVLHENPDFPIDDLGPDDLRNLYRYMVVSRRIDKQAISLQRQGQLGVYASLLGQEAAQVGGAYALEDRDWMFPSFREMGAAIVRGLEPGQLLHQWRGTWLSGHNPYDSNFALMSIPIGTQAIHGAGYAIAAAFDGEDIVVMTYFGDGATSEGDPHEAMNFAAVYDAPCIFFVQNNQYAISTPLSEQTRAPTIAHKGIGYGIPGYRVDGNDVLATYAVTRRAVQRARAGEGPSLIEAVTYRMEAHTTSDDPTRYRTPEEMDEWQRRDPIARFGAYLSAEGLMDDELKDRIDADVETLASGIREEIYEAPHGDPMELFEHVYVDPPAEFADQRALLTRELDAGTNGTEG